VPLAELTRRVLEVPLTAADRRASQGAPGLLDWVTPSAESSARTLVALSAGCRDDRLDDRLTDERARALVAAADARARGLLARRARFASISDRAPWQVRALLGNAWAPEYAATAQAELRNAILRRAVLSATPRGGTAILAATPAGCR
jgi:hypothetical protein